MSGVALNIDVADLGVAADRLAAIAGLIEPSRITDVASAIVETQTRRRIQEEKSAPDGTPWKSWSPAYAETRHSGHSLLQSEGGLLDSIFGEARGEQAVVGSILVYAAIQQFGGEEVGKPELSARPFLGVSDDNLGEIKDVVVDYLNGIGL